MGRPTCYSTATAVIIPRLLDYIAAIEAAQRFSTLEETMPIGEFVVGVRRVARLRHLSYQIEESYLYYINWSEMRDGEGLLDAIRYFGTRARLFYIHLRDVVGRVENFTEVFLGHGNVNPVETVKTLKEAGFNGFIIDDHMPHLVEAGYPRSGWRWGRLGLRSRASRARTRPAETSTDRSESPPLPSSTPRPIWRYMTR
jgi:hypothetical protein